MDNRNDLPRAHEDNTAPLALLAPPTTPVTAATADQNQPTVEDDFPDTAARTGLKTIIEDVKQHYFDGRHPTLKQQWKRLTHAKKYFLRKRNEKYIKPVLRIEGTGDDRNYSEGSDAPSIDVTAMMDELRQAYGADTEFPNTPIGPQAPSQPDRRPKFIKRRYRRHPEKMILLRIKNLDGIWPGAVVWVNDKRKMGHLGCVLSIDYDAGTIIYFPFHTYGGRGLRGQLRGGRCHGAHLHVGVWHPKMKSATETLKYNSKTGCRYKPILINGPDGLSESHGMPLWLHAFAEKGETLLLRLIPEGPLPFSNILGIVGYVSPATLEWLKTVHETLDDMGIANFDYEAAMKAGRADEIVDRLQDATDRRARLDKAPPDTAGLGGLDYETWGRCIVNDGDPAETQWEAQPQVLHTFLREMDIMEKVLEEVCSPSFLNANMPEHFQSMYVVYCICSAIVEAATRSARLCAAIGEPHYKILAKFAVDMAQLQLEKLPSARKLGQGVFDQCQAYMEGLPPFVVEQKASGITDAATGLNMGDAIADASAGASTLNSSNTCDQTTTAQNAQAAPSSTETGSLAQLVQATNAANAMPPSANPTTTGAAEAEERPGVHERRNARAGQDHDGRGRARSRSPRTEDRHPTRRDRDEVGGIRRPYMAVDDGDGYARRG